MRNAKKVFGIIVIAAVIGLCLVGCKEEPEVYTKHFVNHSSYTVNITCDDISPSSFSLSPGSTRSFTTTKSVITITYSPSNSVNCTSSPGYFTFTNK